MGISLTASVGMGGINKPVDVLTIQTSLNRIPSLQGGPTPLLDPDSKIGPNTIGAIARFQKFHLKFSDGRVDVGKATHQKLNTLLETLPLVADVGLNNPAASPLAWPNAELHQAMLDRVKELLAGTEAATKVGSWLDTLSPARLTAIDVALQECNPPPGKVSDLVTNNLRDPWDGKIKRIRIGWQRLQTYFEQGTRNFLDMKKVEHREGILCWNKRVQAPGLPTAPGTTTGVHWCGIFATWVYKQVQSRWPNFVRRDLFWKFPLISMPQYLAMNQGGKLDMQPGDVGVILKNTHHFVVVTPPQDGIVWTVNGNDDYQSILLKPRKVKDILMQYKADEIFM
jgi:hypothetical protein